MYRIERVRHLHVELQERHAGYLVILTHWKDIFSLSSSHSGVVLWNSMHSRAVMTE